MDRELTTRSTPNATVTPNIIFSTPLKDLYMLKEPLRPDDKPAVLDWISTKTIIKEHIIIWAILLIRSMFITYYKDFPKISTWCLS